MPRRRDVVLATLSPRRHRLLCIKYTPHWAHVSEQQGGGIWTGNLAQPTAREGRFLPLPLLPLLLARPHLPQGWLKLKFSTCAADDVAFTFVYLGFSIAKEKNFSSVFFPLFVAYAFLYIQIKIYMAAQSVRWLGGKRNLLYEMSKLQSKFKLNARKWENIHLSAYEETFSAARPASRCLSSLLLLLLLFLLLLLLLLFLLLFVFLRQFFIVHCTSLGLLLLLLFELLLIAFISCWAKA